MCLSVSCVARLRVSALAAAVVLMLLVGARNRREAERKAALVESKARGLKAVGAVALGPRSGSSSSMMAVTVAHVPEELTLTGAGDGAQEGAVAPLVHRDGRNGGVPDDMGEDGTSGLFECDRVLAQRGPSPVSGEGSANTAATSTSGFMVVAAPAAATTGAAWTAGGKRDAVSAFLLAVLGMC